MTEPEVRERLRLNRLADLEKAARDYHFAVESSSSRLKLYEDQLRGAAFVYASTANERIGAPCEKCPWLSQAERDRLALTPAVKNAATMGQEFVCHFRMGRCWGAYIYREQIPAPVAKDMTLKDLAGAAEALAASVGDLPVEVRSPSGESAALGDLRAEMRGTRKKRKIVVFLDTEPS